MNAEVSLHNAFPMNNDKITLRSAMEEPVWMMVYAAEPERNIDVTMTYADLFIIFKLIQEQKGIPLDKMFKLIAKGGEE